MGGPLLIPTEEAVRLSGYETARKFRCAIQRGKMPKPYDEHARPQLWSRAEITAMLPGHTEPVQDEDAEFIKQRLGLA